MTSVVVRDPASPSRPAAIDSWIVCRGTTRDVVAGTVACPVRGTATVDVCRDCRFLETVPGEWRRWSCGSDDR